MKEIYLSRFTPSLMTPKALEEIFVQRQKLANQMIELIRDSALNPAKHYTLLIGPRGIGKTHLISLVYYRICQMDDMSDRLLIAWLREEEWGIMSFLDLLLRILRALQEEYIDTQLAHQVESLYELPSDAAERAAATLLKQAIGNRTLLLLVENLDEVFAGLGDEGQKQLRAYLQENAFCTILATAQSLFNGVKLQTSPFYGFFRIRHLKDLTPDEATQLLVNIAKLEDNCELESFIQTPTGRDRIQALHYLAGGNHRVYIIFSQFLTRKSLNQLVEAFMRTLDDLTPYYQARMAWLSPQQRKIIEFLCDRRHAVAVKEIAQHCFITHQTASSQLKDLREKGYVTSESTGRESYYELRELLMRFCLEVKKQRGEPLRLVVEFLRFWYSQTELQQRLNLLPSDAALEREYVLHALRATEDPHITAYLNDLKAYIEKKDFVHAVQVLEKLEAICGHEWEWIRGCCLHLLERYDEALASFYKAIELHPNDAIVWFFLGNALLSLKRYEEVLTCCNKAIELHLNNAEVWYLRSMILSMLKRYEEALTSLNKTIELHPNDAISWELRGQMLLILKNYDEALESFNKAIELDSNSASSWGMRGMVLYYFKRHKEALASINKATELGEQSSYVFFTRAKSLLALNQWDEGSAALDDAFHRFAHADELYNKGDVKEIVCNLFNSTHDASIWRARLTTLIQLYDKHQVVYALVKGIVGSIPTLMSPMISDVAARTWLEVWRELTSDRPKFQIPLRLLNAAVRYRETKGNPRVLLELPVEERKLLKPLLGIEE